jgi:hypothetical protein
VAAQHDASQGTVDLADRLSPHGIDASVPITDPFAPPAVADTANPSPLR